MLQHVSVETHPRDADAAVAFWALLGFTEVEPPGTLGERSRWVQRGHTQIHLLLADDPVVPPSGHVAVVTEDYEAAVARVRDAGFDVTPREQHWGAARAFARAPGGHVVELMAQPPPG